MQDVLRKLRCDVKTWWCGIVVKNVACAISCVTAV